jgi:F-type H+-transporting ATPase subunit b
MESPGLISPNLATFALTLVNIGILCLLLRAILFKPVTKFMEARAKKIEDTINHAEREKQEAKQMLSQYEERLRNAEAEADEIIKSAKEDAAQEAKRITDEGKKSAEILMANARKQIELEHDAAFLQFKAEAVMLIVAASSKLIARDLRKEDNQHFVNVLLEEFSSERVARQRNA